MNTGWLAAICAAAVLAEGAGREELAGRPLTVALGVALAGAVAFRRTHPLAATAFAFGSITASTLVQVWRGLPEVGPYAAACVLLLPYSLGRWGSGREVAVGSVFMACACAASLLRPGSATDALGGAIVLFSPAMFGLSQRVGAEARERELERAKLREREQLARELHDSVAHHVTAITLQAQAARAVLASRPDVALSALTAIESESKRTLAELREIVGALREQDAAALGPAGRLADIAAFAREDAVPAVTVELCGDLEGLPVSVERALYRLAQESLTNALRHASGARRVSIRVAAEGERVRLTARDDGAPSGARREGLGLVGMAERAALLGGTFSAGPDAGGWRVEAALPRTGGAL